MATKAVLDALRVKFPANEVLQRRGGGTTLDYVPIQAMIGRVLDATLEEGGYRYNGALKHLEQVERVKNDGKTVLEWVAVVEGTLYIGDACGYGIGSMQNADLDMAVKSANSEAFKNAAKNGFGVGLELWDKEYREGLGQQRRLLAGSEQAMKAEVFRIAKEKLGIEKPTAAQVAGVFARKAGDLSDEDNLRDILVDAGVL